MTLYILLRFTWKYPISSVLVPIILYFYYWVQIGGLSLKKDKNEKHILFTFICYLVLIHLS